MENKGFSSESIKTPGISGSSLSPGMLFSGTKLQVKFDGSCLKQEKKNTNITMVNLHNVYEINLWPYNIGTDFTLENSLFEAVKLTKNTDLHQHS